MGLPVPATERANEIMDAAPLRPQHQPDDEAMEHIAGTLREQSRIWGAPAAIRGCEAGARVTGSSYSPRLMKSPRGSKWEESTRRSVGPGIGGGVRTGLKQSTSDRRSPRAWRC